MIDQLLPGRPNNFYARLMHHAGLCRPGCLFCQRAERRRPLSPSCDSSCYDCLRDYDNADLHGLLDWRLGLDLAALSAGGAAIDLDQPHWIGLAERAATNLARGLADASATQFGRFHAVFRGDRLMAILTHPLWSPNHPALEQLARECCLSPLDLPCCTVFDALRRPGWFLAQQHVTGGLLLPHRPDAPAIPVAGGAQAPLFDLSELLLPDAKPLGQVAAPAGLNGDCFTVNYSRPDLSDVVPLGGLAIFRRLAADEALPAQGEIVLVRHPGLPAGIAAGEFRYMRLVRPGGNDRLVRVSLRPRSSAVGAATRTVEMTPEEFELFRPYAILVHPSTTGS